ncbi:tautomerase family protein [Roseomonas elaeocarpi]|uniref:4-oxalocrotonate tautomerase family protein n=1 Tax=Roseomonas elaeocarpi TaxID=907779 RepID=A0ABV6JMU6_9PROT
MPYVEILAPPVLPETRQAVAEGVTAGICEAFAVGPQTVTLYFLDVAGAHYAHAGRAGEAAGTQRIFVKVHAYRRGVAERRAAAAALTPALARHYGVPEATLAIYFFDRAKDEVAHGGRLSSDVQPD